MCALCRFSYSRRALVIHCLFAWARSIPERTEGRNDADVPQNQGIWGSAACNQSSGNLLSSQYFDARLTNSTSVLRILS
jgi:hypothetical protein